MKYIIIILMLLTSYLQAKEIEFYDLHKKVDCEYKINGKVVKTKVRLFTIKHKDKFEYTKRYMAYYIENCVLMYYIALGPDCRLYFRSDDSRIVYRDDIYIKWFMREGCVYISFQENGIKVELIIKRVDL